MILAIESSCDDSAISITELGTRKVVFHERISQEAQHAQYGGVVPELAARIHADNLPEILKAAEEYLPAVKAVAVTNAPGLVVSLLEGVVMAKAIALALNVPVIPINHIKGHIYSVFIEKETQFPMSILMVSGGHTQVIEAKSYSDMRVVGSSLDDSAGESFDKVAKMLGLGYPGGPIIEELAKKGDRDRFAFTLPLKRSKEVAFSYSGLKNGVRLVIEELGEGITEQDRCDVAASFQKAALGHIFDKLKRYFVLKESSAELHATIRPQKLAVVGGVSANEYFREHLVELCLEYGVETLFADLQYCSDNAAMIGRAALDAYEEERFIAIDDLDVHSRVSLENG